MAFEPDHGHCKRVNGRKTKSPSWQSWSTMNDRCYNPNKKQYKDYGGRGITVCEAWRRGTPYAFANFLADMGTRPAGLSLDRKDVNGNYEKGNCVWSTASQQRRNQRRSQRGPASSD